MVLVCLYEVSIVDGRYVPWFGANRETFFQIQSKEIIVAPWTNLYPVKIHRQPIIWWYPIHPIKPHIPVALGVITAGTGFDEPWMLVGGVVEHHVKDHPDAALVGSVQKMFEIF